jgi:hypothetical protein
MNNKINKTFNEFKSYLSIDVGRRNLGFSVLNTLNFNFNFGIYDLSERKFLRNKDKTRRQKANKKTLNYIITSLNEFLNIIFKKYKITVLIIEKQVKRNTAALNIMWIIIEYCLINNCEVIIFNAGDKFKYENISYDSKHKEHKKICVRYAKNILKFNCLDEKIIDNYRKKDDISDSICMLFIVVYSNDINKINGCKKDYKNNCKICNFKINNDSKDLIKKMMCNK